MLRLNTQHSTLNTTMIECRAVRPDELDSMLSLMCEAFGLPFAPARELFYKDPYFDVEKKRVLTVDGRIVSCLTIVEAPLWIGSAVARVAGVAGVATALPHRRSGYAHRLLAETLPALRDTGFPFAALFPFSYDYYRKLGWERAGSHYSIRVDRAQLPPFHEARHVRAARASDHRDIARLYDRWSLQKTGRWVRDSRRWSYLFQHAKSCVVYNRGGLAGYAIYDILEETGGRNARILEMAAESDDARRGIAGYFAGLKDARTVTQIGSLTELEEWGLVSHLEPAEERPPIRVEPGVMFRIVDLPAAIRALAPNFEGWRGELILTMTDQNAPNDWPRGARVTGRDHGVVVEPLPPGNPLLKSRTRIDGDVRAWSRVLAGFYSLADAISLNRLHAHGADVRAELEDSRVELFPRREMLVPPADHF